jgi:hypothetical protein
MQKNRIATGHFLKTTLPYFIFLKIDIIQHDIHV